MTAPLGARIRGFPGVARRRPITTAVALLVLVAIPGYGRIEVATNDAAAAAAAARAAVAKANAADARDDARQAAAELEDCREDNTANASERAHFSQFIDGLVTVSGNATDPETQARVDELRRIGIAAPADTDRDCDGDGALDPDDYEGG